MTEVSPWVVFAKCSRGPNSLARGFIVLSGTQKLAETMREPKCAAVFRRISIAPIFLDWLSTHDLQKLFRHFVLEFVPGSTEEELHEQGRRFISNANTWGRGGISIDMVKQFLMKRISSFRAAKLSTDNLEPGTAFIVPSQLRQRFFDHLCENGPAISHLESYPPVGECASISVEQ